MISEKVLIANASGLHARPLSKFVSLVKSTGCRVAMGTPKGEVDCRSIVGLLAAAVKPGTEIEIRVEGEGEADALAKLVDFLENLD